MARRAETPFCGLVAARRARSTSCTWTGETFVWPDSCACCKVAPLSCFLFFIRSLARSLACLRTAIPIKFPSCSRGPSERANERRPGRQLCMEARLAHVARRCFVCRRARDVPAIRIDSLSAPDSDTRKLAPKHRQTDRQADSQRGGRTHVTSSAPLREAGRSGYVCACLPVCALGAQPNQSGSRTGVRLAGWLQSGRRQTRRAAANNLLAASNDDNRGRHQLVGRPLFGAAQSGLLAANTPQTTRSCAPQVCNPIRWSRAPAGLCGVGEIN